MDQPSQVGSEAFVLRQIFDELSGIRKKLDELTELKTDHNATKGAVARAFVEIDRLGARIGESESNLRTRDGELEKRLAVIETQQPVYDLMKKWVFGVFFLIIVTVVGALLVVVVPLSRLSH